MISVDAIEAVAVVVAEVGLAQLMAVLITGYVAGRWRFKRGEKALRRHPH